MSTFTLHTHDDGRLVVNDDFAAVLRSAGLLTFDALWDYTGGTIAKNLLKERTTTRVALNHAGSEHVFFLKRHTRPPLKEYIKPFFRLTWPILGARNEWNAILKFHEARIPTMTPAALGECGGRSLLLTAAIQGCRKLSQVMDGTRRIDAEHDVQAARPIVRSIARAARTMHSHGLHHQDFYLGHLMIPEDGPPEPLYVIDLGRVRQSRHLSRRWIVKDLAQLNYSARHASRSERLRFLEEYLGRPVTAADRPLLQSIARKTERIASHSKKNKL